MKSPIKKVLPQVALADYEEAVHNYGGWCTGCKAFTRDCTEPDAEDYLCYECDKPTVFGAEEALMRGLFEVK